MTRADILTTEEILEGLKEFAYRFTENEWGTGSGKDPNIEQKILKIVFHLPSLTYYALIQVRGEVYTLEQVGEGESELMWASVAVGVEHPIDCELVWEAGENNRHD